MKKFVWKCVLGLLPVAAWYLYMLCCPYWFMDGEYPYWMQQKDYIYSKSDDRMDAVVLGDSVAKSSIRPKLIVDADVVNIAVGGATSIEMYYSLQTYLANHMCPKTVIILYAASHYDGLGTFVDRNLYFHYFSHDEVKEVRSYAKELQDPFLATDEMEKAIWDYYMYNPEKYLPAIYNSGFVGRRDFNHQQYQLRWDEKGWMLFGTADGYYDLHAMASRENFEPIPLIDMYLHKLMDLCDENEIVVIVEQAPINKASHGLIKKEVQEQFRSYFDRLASEYDNAIVNDLYMEYENELFGDAAHLNEMGAEKYTEYIEEKYSELW